MKWTFKNNQPVLEVPVPPPGYILPLPEKKEKKKINKYAVMPTRFGARWAVWFTPWWEKVLTILYYGPRSQGKSLHQAKTAMQMLKYLNSLYIIYPKLPQAIVVSNQKFCKEIEDVYLDRRLYYWENIRQLRYCPRKDCWVKEKKHVLHDAYLIIDDAATIIPADGWRDLPRWFRKVFAQAGHNGVHCLANCQDPNSVDINFRRYVDTAFKFHKIVGCRRPEAGKPPVRSIWGIYSSRQIDAEELWRNGDMTEYEVELQRAQLDDAKGTGDISKASKVVTRFLNKQWKQRFHWIGKTSTEIYDTLQNVPEYMPNSYEHLEMKCSDPDCKFKHVRHRPI